MGYTHYWNQTRDFKQHEWAMIRIAIDELTKNASVLDKDPKSDQCLSIKDNNIFFNGIGEDGHETFIIPRLMPAIAEWDKEGQEKNRSFDSCKTARKYYDDYVCASLIIIAHLAPGVLLISSDGEKDEWAEGLKKAKKILPNVEMFKFKHEEYADWKKAI